jgi:ATP-binding cassette subfamily F protein uup
LFDPEDLNQRVGKLSGGERARVLIAQLMLQEADVLLLDEPTNDLDIPTLEILEESLLEFKGALLLVTHDRYLLDRVSTIVLGLDGRGGAERFADYSQWDAWQRKHTSSRGTALSKGSRKGPGGSRPQGSNGRSNVNAQAVAATATKRKLSYQEEREFANIEDNLVQAEAELSAARGELADPELASDVQRLMEACKRMEEAQNKVEQLYARWAELSEKKE